MEVAIDRLKSCNNLAIIGQLIKLNFGDKMEENACSFHVEKEFYYMLNFKNIVSNVMKMHYFWIYRLRH